VKRKTYEDIKYKKHKTYKRDFQEEVEEAISDFGLKLNIIENKKHFC